MERAYIITGASSDIGVHFLKRLLDAAQEEKICVFAQYHTSDEDLRTVFCGHNNAILESYRCDLADRGASQNWIDSLSAKGVVPTHILHLAATPFAYMRLKNLDWDVFQRGLDISVRTFALLLQAFMPAMGKARFGRILAMLTAYTDGVPPKYMCDYVTAKYALLGLVRAAASEYAGKGVTVNGLSPNMMETKFLAQIDPRSIEMNAQSTAMKRNISLDEVCAAMEYLLSDEASYIQGVNMNLSGGDRM